MVLIVLRLVLVTNDVMQHHFYKHKIYLLRIFSIVPASISVKKRLFSSKQHRSTRRNNSLHPGYLTSLATRTNHNTLQTIGICVRVFRTADHTGQIFIPHRNAVPGTCYLAGTRVPVLIIKSAGTLSTNRFRTYSQWAVIMNMNL